MNLSGSNSITSKANLTIKGDGDIVANAPLILDASANLSFDATSMIVTRESLLKFKAGANFLCNTPLSLSGSYPSQRIVFNSMTINLTTDCSISAGLSTDIIELLPLCSGLTCYQDFGGMSNPRTWHLSNQELGKITVSISRSELHFMYYIF
jgi:hypothetical protein